LGGVSLAGASLLLRHNVLGCLVCFLFVHALVTTGIWGVVCRRWRTLPRGHLGRVGGSAYRLVPISCAGLFSGPSGAQIRVGVALWLVVGYCCSGRCSTGPS